MNGIETHQERRSAPACPRAERARAALSARLLALALFLPGLANAQSLLLSAHDRSGAPVSSLTDGNTISLRATLPKPAPRATDVIFHLDADQEIARCTIVARANHCEVSELAALGWYWSAAGQPKSTRTLTAAAALGRSAPLELRVTPRPVVLVHGFMSNDKTWLAYTKPDGFLAAAGLAAFAVGDGKAEGALNMGDVAQPTAPTRTLPENAAALGRYIADVKRITGAEMVDVVAHSMGGLVARYYLARVMAARDVAQLLMLGTPHGGSDCSALPSALGFFAPASYELRPAFVRRIFNPSALQRGNVPFHILAGDPIVDGFKSPCSGVPSDVVVGLDSAGAIPARVRRLPVLHTDMTASEEVFRSFVLPLLKTTAGNFSQSSSTLAPPEPTSPAQFTQVFTGKVAPGGTTDVDINIDDVAVASFALFDPSRSLTVTVRGASGNSIALSPETHGLIKIDDPASLVHLGYGVDKPRPGPWRVTLHATPQTGTDFALAVRVVGGPVLRTRASSLTPRINQPVTLAATLDAHGKATTELALEAVVLRPDGKSERIALHRRGAEMIAAWTPAQRGLHGIDIVAKAVVEGMPVERTAFMAIDVRP